MAPFKEKGDLAELIVAADLARRGWEIAVPWGENSDFDLIAFRGDQLERVQVKYSGASPDIVQVRCHSQSLTNGRVRQVKRYTAAMIDWIAVYHQPSDRCFYVPASELGNGRAMLHLRLAPSLNNQRAGIRLADDYTEFAAAMEPAGLEPAAFRMQTERSPN
jgi:hypothetical protein